MKFVVVATFAVCLTMAFLDSSDSSDVEASDLNTGTCSVVWKHPGRAWSVDALRARCPSLCSGMVNRGLRYRSDGIWYCQCLDCASVPSGCTNIWRHPGWAWTVGELRRRCPGLCQAVSATNKGLQRHNGVRQCLCQRCARPAPTPKRTPSPKPRTPAPKPRTPAPVPSPKPSVSCTGKTCKGYPLARCSVESGELVWRGHLGKVVDCNECIRRRKNWNDMSTSERNLFIKGMKALRTSGKYEVFTTAHYANAASTHSTSFFLPWHRHFIWELETAVRSLGAEYKCWALAYWAWDEGDAIFQTGIGGDGAEPSRCVASGEFTLAKGYSTNRLCGGGQSSCCLKRTFNLGIQMASSAALTSAIVDNPQFGAEFGYRRALERNHDRGHVRVGSNARSHMYTMYSPDDPIFFLHHTYVDYQWAHWVDCWDYDTINQNSLTDTQYTNSRGTDGIDNVMPYSNLNDKSWTHMYGAHNKLTPRVMHDIRSWNVEYTMSSMHTNANCYGSTGGSRNTAWFVPASQSLLESVALHYRRSYRRTDWQKKRRARFKQDWISLQYDVEEGSLTNKMAVNVHALHECRIDRAHNKYTANVQKNIQTHYDKCGSCWNDPNFKPSLNDLVKKVSKYPRLVKQRRAFYGWEQNFGSRSLCELCNGMYDPDC